MKSGKLSDVSGNLLSIYNYAKQVIVEHGFYHEVELEKAKKFSEFSEADLLAEVAWVVLCGGFRESIVRKKFDYISLCFCEWTSAKEILTRREMCISSAMHAIGNRSKLEAIARDVTEIKERLRNSD